MHGAIEFGNRLITLVLVIAAALTFVSALLYRENGRPRTDLRWLAAGLAMGIPLQGVIGGITVLTQLNPYVVALHLLLSMVLIALAVWLVRKAWHLTPAHVTGLSVAATRVTFVLMWLAIWLGTLVTGSGPHAGDQNAPRNGLDAMLLTRLHTSVVYATLAATVICFALLRSRAQWCSTTRRDGAGGNRRGPIPTGTTDLAGRAPPARRIAGDCGATNLMLSVSRR